MLKKLLAYKNELDKAFNFNISTSRVRQLVQYHFPPTHFISLPITAVLSRSFNLHLHNRHGLQNLRLSLGAQIHSLSKANSLSTNGSEDEHAPSFEDASPAPVIDGGGGVRVIRTQSK
ncbi:uncharacterized protein LOC112200175 isoform X2 [Rosa chinensis]|uniref:uncharacterized protein LOC112200175 isoform X2 n=1 Tax=Rosa chinensis TaxID=74649 RepID=UPI001AD8AF71|nr:uncharacterized protein LOC112200175 isoform X2 [Rosa chinensis]